MTGGEADRSARLTAALAPYLDAEADGRGVLLAVSGGPDSTALLHAAAVLRAGRPLFVATVDHGLRSEAAAEASEVGAFATRLDLPHRTLVWQPPIELSGLQAAARRARYALLAQHALEIGATLILTAHHADDQAETVLMRLIAGSGPVGLAGMARERELVGGVKLARPFLDLGKADLIAYCRNHDLSYASDPSNADGRYGRARLRAALPARAREGLTPDRLRRLAARLARDAEALASAADALLAAVRRPGAAGEMRLDGRRLETEPAALVLRVIDRALDRASASTMPDPFKRLVRLERLVLDELMPALAQRRVLRRTLRGILVELRADGEIRLSPAPPRRGGPR